MTQVALPARGERRRPRRTRPALTTLAWGAGGFVLFVAAWEIVARTSGLGEETMPGALRVLGAMAGLAVDPVYLVAIGETLWSAFLGLLLSLVIGVPLGVLLGSSLATFRATSALIDLIRPVPSVALIPAAVLIFGPGTEMKVFLITFSIVWTILLNTIYAVRDVDPQVKETAQLFGFSRWQVLSRVVLPSAAPFVYTGVRIGAVGALIVAVAAELLTGGGGLGEWLVDRQQALTVNHLVYAGALLSGVAGVLINVGLDRGERAMFAWHASMRGSAA